MGIKAGHSLLNRSNLRDVVLVCSFVCAVFYGITEGETAVGFSLLVIGCFLHVVSKGILARNVVLCRKGIYGVVRHPYYLSSYLIDSGFCLLSGNHLLLLLYPFLFFWAYRPTMRKEETLLAEKYGDTFMTYEQEVPQVFPDRGSFKHLATFFDGYSQERISWKECARVSRFCSLGIFLTLVHDVAANGLSNLHAIGPVLRDWVDLPFVLLAIMLYVASVIFMRMSNRNGRRADDLSR
jgi:Phospholipid methyltransferase